MQCYTGESESELREIYSKNQETVVLKIKHEWNREASGEVRLLEEKVTGLGSQGLSKLSPDN